MKIIKIIFGQAVVILAVIIIAVVLNQAGNLSIHLPAKVYSRIPRYEVADDKKTVYFDNGYLIEFKRPPEKEEIIKAYTGKDVSLIKMKAMDDSMFKDFLFINLDLSRGIIGLQLKALSLFILLFGYPLYLISCFTIWVVRLAEKRFLPISN